MWKIIIGIVGGLVVLVGGGGALVMMSPVGAQLRGEGGNKEVGTPIRLEAAARGDLIRTVSAPGSLEPRKMVSISSQVSAEVLALPFREGDFVKAGDVVVRLDPQDLVARLDSAKASMKGQQARLGGAEATLTNARIEYDRMRQLLETGDVTQSEVDAAEARFLGAESSRQVIEFGIEQANAVVAQAQEDLDNTIISSPMDGVVTVLNLEVGETAIVGTMNNAGSVIMEVADLSEMLLRAQVDETNIAPVREGQDAKIFINAYSGSEYDGVVQNIALKRRIANDGTGIFEVEIGIEIPEGETLYSGLTASTEISVEQFYDTIKVPSQSVLDRRTEELPDDIRLDNPNVDTKKTFTSVVYRLIDGKAVATPVTEGPSDLTHTVIESGLEPGDKVVAGPYRVLIDINHDQALRDQDKIAEKGKDAGDADDAEAEDESEGSEPVDDDADESIETTDDAATEDDTQADG